MIPINAWLADRVEGLQISQMELKDERVKLTNEVSHFVCIPLLILLQTSGSYIFTQYFCSMLILF